MKTKDHILTVTKAEYVDASTLLLSFSNGEQRLFDFTPLFDKGICRKLADPEYFKAFKLDPFTVDWNDEIACAPEYLYEHGEVSVSQRPNR